jgi:hypothetical protein
VRALYIAVPVRFVRVSFLETRAGVWENGGSRVESVDSGQWVVVSRQSRRDMGDGGEEEI